MKIKYKCKKRVYDRDYENWKVGDIIVVDEAFDVVDLNQLIKLKLSKGDECVIIEKSGLVHVSIKNKMIMRAESFKRVKYEDKMEIK